MENDQHNIELNENTSSLGTNIFKPEYEEQKLNNHNIAFLKWKKSMIKIYGEKSMLFKCLNDKIYFYTSYEECKRYPIYQSKCPECGNPICYYCSRYEVDIFGENGSCCLKRKIKCMFNQECYRYIKGNYNEKYIYTYKQAFISFIIPVIHLFILIAQIQGIFYYKIIIRDIKKSKGGIRYYEHLKVYKLVEFINIGVAIFLVIPLFFIHIYFIIFLLVISLPFKFIPLKYFLGIHFATVNIADIFCGFNTK